MISVTILSKNNQETIRSTLDSLRYFPEILLFDTGSTDLTMQIAKEYANIKIIQDTFIGFGPSHNLATSLATYDWILSIDSDEILSPDLMIELKNLKLNPECVYSIQRKNFFNQKWIQWCAGWHPDRVVRLYNRQKTQFRNVQVHEQVSADHLQTCALQSPLFHTPYRKIEDFLTKMQTYSTLFAQQNAHKKNSSLWTALLHSWLAFVKSYVFKRGFLGGKEGFIISLYNGHTTFYKYLKLMEINTLPSQQQHLEPLEEAHIPTQ